MQTDGGMLERLQDKIQTLEKERESILMMSKRVIVENQWQIKRLKLAYVWCLQGC